MEVYHPPSWDSRQGQFFNAWLSAHDLHRCGYPEGGQAQGAVIIVTASMVEVSNYTHVTAAANYTHVTAAEMANTFAPVRALHPRRIHRQSTYFTSTDS